MAETPSGVDVPGLIPNVAEGAVGGGVASPSEETIHVATTKAASTATAEIATAMEFRSPNAAEEHLRTLERKGAIEILKGSARGIRLVDGGGIPLIGRVAAGSPILAEEHIQAHYQIDPALYRA